MTSKWMKEDEKLDQTNACLPRNPLRRCRRNAKSKKSGRGHQKPTSRGQRSSTKTWTCSQCDSIAFSHSAGPSEDPLRLVATTAKSKPILFLLLSRKFCTVLVHLLTANPLKLSWHHMTKSRTGSSSQHSTTRPPQEAQIHHDAPSGLETTQLV